VARDKYQQVAGLEALASAKLGIEEAGGIVLERSIRMPGAIVGLGKESGEIEYTADTVTVAVTCPSEIERSDSSAGYGQLVVFATAKHRAAPPAWCAMHFNGWRFSKDGSDGRDVMNALRSKAEQDAQRKLEAARARKSNGSKPTQPDGSEPPISESEIDNAFGRRTRA
jgi:hypothetical protein